MTNQFFQSLLQFSQIKKEIELAAGLCPLLEILIQELDEMVESHGDGRLSAIDPMPLSMDREDLVAEEAIVISLTNDNYIRHLPVEAFRLQNRGGKGLKGVATKDEDAPSKIVTCFSKDRLLIHPWFYPMPHSESSLHAVPSPSLQNISKVGFL